MRTIREQLLAGVGMLVITFAAFYWGVCEGRKELQQIKTQSVSNIKRAAELEKESRELKINLAVYYNVGFVESQRGRAKEFLVRIKNNKELADACLKAKDKNVVIIMADYFSVDAGLVTVDPRASDEKIIRFLTN